MEMVKLMIIYVELYVSKKKKLKKYMVGIFFTYYCVVEYQF